MSFVQKNLATNETIVYKTRLHWWKFVSGGFVFLLGLLLMSQSNGFSGFLLFIGLVMLAVAYVNWSSSEFVITNKRVILKTGFIRRQLVEIQLNMAQGLVIEQGILGRIFNFGGVLVTSGGVRNSFAPMAAPFVFKKEVNEAVETYTVQR